jgi:hypothetical protein
MGNTPQQTAINFAVQGMTLAQNLSTLSASVAAYMAQYSAIVPDTQWIQMATFVLNADGSSGAADATPNNAHPISIGGINKSRAQLIAMITAFIQFQNLMNNAAVTQGAYGTNLNVVGL